MTKQATSRISGNASMNAIVDRRWVKRFIEEACRASPRDRDTTPIGTLVPSAILSSLPPAAGTGFLPVSSLQRVNPSTSSDAQARAWTTVGPLLRSAGIVGITPHRPVRTASSGAAGEAATGCFASRNGRIVGVYTVPCGGSTSAPVTCGRACRSAHVLSHDGRVPPEPYMPSGDAPAGDATLPHFNA